MVLKLWDYHTHHLRCKHAEGQLSDYVDNAIQKGLGEIGLSDHFPMELLPESADVWKYAMKIEEFPQYLAECKQLREKHQNKITLKIATEVDFFKPVFTQYTNLIKPYWDDLDYLIGSIHVVQWEGISAWGIDDEQFIAKFKECGPDKVYTEYYNSIIELAKTHYFNIIGHLDVPKKFKILPDNPEKVHEKVLDIMDAAQKNDMAIEINMAGFLKPIGEQYPSDKIIKEMIDRKIPITFGSDAHDPKNVGYNFDLVLKKVKKMGLTHLCKWSKHEKTLIPII